jgi:hypothetical protein
MSKKVIFIGIVFVGISKYGIKVLKMEVKSITSLGNELTGYCYMVQLTYHRCHVRSGLGIFNMRLFQVFNFSSNILSILFFI